MPILTKNIFFVPLNSQYNIFIFGDSKIQYLFNSGRHYPMLVKNPNKLLQISFVLVSFGLHLVPVSRSIFECKKGVVAGSRGCWNFDFHHGNCQLPHGAYGEGFVDAVSNKNFNFLLLYKVKYLGIRATNYGV